MENNVQVFSSEEFGSVRTLTIDGEPWFAGKDVCYAFGDKNHNRSLGRIDSEDRMENEVIDSLGRTQKAIFINESGLYSLLFAMQPEKANKDGVSDAYPIEVQQRIEKLRKFKRWITSEVIPTIRKTGGYVADADAFLLSYLPNADEQTKIMFKAQLSVIRDLNTKVGRLEAKVKEDAPKVLFADKVCDSSDTVSIGTLAKLLNEEGFNIGRNKLFKLLREKKILMVNNMPYQQYVDREYFKVVDSTFETPYGTIATQTALVTGRGQIFITETLRAEKTESAA